MRTRRRALRWLAAAAGAGAGAGVGRIGWPAEPAADEILARVAATYAALESYADTGTVATEYQPQGAAALIERHSFTTRFRRPRQFYFEFNADPAGSGERLAVWCEGGDFQSWWSATRVHEFYPQGRGNLAFLLAIAPTHGSAMQIAPLLFAQAGLYGPINGMLDAQRIGVEPLDGRRHYKLRAATRTNGRLTEDLPTTVWIDAQRWLVSQVVEDHSQGAIVARTTTRLSPQPQAELTDSQFRFVPPARS